MVNSNDMKAIAYFIGAAALLASACNKPGEEYDFDTSRYRSIYTVQARNYPSVYTISMERDTTIRLNANYGGLDVPQEDITVTFGADPGLVSSFNEDNQTLYPALFTEAYTIHDAQTVISKGMLYSSQAEVAIHPSQFRGVGPYILPVSITSVSPELPVNSSMKTVYLQIEGHHDSNPYPYFDRTGWKLLSVSSQHNTTTYKAANIFDDDLSTFWHTSYAAGNQPGPPHILIVDMQTTKEIHGLEVNGRTASATNLETPYHRGNPRIINLQVSDDNTTWTDAGTYVIPGAGVTVKNYVYLSSYVSGRYFKFTVTATLADYYGTNVSELYLF